MSNITLREKEVFLAVSHLGNVLLKIRKEKKKKEWDGRGQNQHSTQKGKHKVSSITDQSTLI